MSGGWTRHAAAWRRWATLVLGGPLASLGGTIPDLAAELDASWTAAVRETSARLLLAGSRERLLDGRLQGDALRVGLDGRDVTLPVRRHAFELHRVAWGQGHAIDPLLDDPLAIAAWIHTRADVGPDDRARVCTELLDSIANLAQSRLAQGLRDRMALTMAGDMDPRLHDPEHFVTDGHPWHPMTRTRLGLRRAESLRHAAELLATAQIGCVDVEADLVRCTDAWAETIAPMFGAPARGWVRIPVHPCAARRLAQWGWSFRPAPTALVPVRSLLSLRTVVLDPAWHLKLSTPMLTTSARRGVSPMSVHNGPIVSRLIADIQRDDPLTAALVLMPEPAAAGLEPERVGPRAGELGAIMRAVPPLEGRRAWVCAAMGERWPGTRELVLERAAAGYPGHPKARVQALLHDWIVKLVPPALRLWSVHGVALELHGQNTLAVLDGDGTLAHLRVRDLGGIRLHGPRLRARGHTPSFAAESFILTDDLDEVRGKLEHTVFHSHLASVFEAAARLGLDEDRLWADVRAVVDRCYGAWTNEPELGEATRRELAADHAALLRPRVRAKALLRMRLSEVSTDYAYTEVDNVLARESIHTTAAAG